VSPDGTKVALFLPYSVYEKNPNKAELVIDVRGLDGTAVQTIEANKAALGNIGPPMLIDKWNNLYMGREAPEQESDLPPEKLLLGFIRGDTGRYSVISRTNEILVTNMLVP
jgi:hypothetical protein